MQGTGLWSCCGMDVHLSVYCDSEQARTDWTAFLETDKKTKQDALDYKPRRKQELLNHIEAAKNTNPELLAMDLTEEEKAIRDQCSTEDSFNAPMCASHFPSVLSPLV